MNFKIVFIPVFGEDMVFEQECETLVEAEASLKAVSDYTLLLHDIFCLQNSN